MALRGTPCDLLHRRIWLEVDRLCVFRLGSVSRLFLASLLLPVPASLGDPLGLHTEILRGRVVRKFVAGVSKPAVGVER